MEETHGKDTRPATVILEQIKNTLKELNSDSESDELTFPIRTNQEAEDYIEKLTKLENDQRSTILEQNRQLEVSGYVRYLCTIFFDPVTLLKLFWIWTSMIW